MSLHGVALVDKPIGMSSFAVVSRMRRAFRDLGISKAGHTGTLDPLASGLLPICLGEATKFAQRLLDADKGYQATIQFGSATTTGDAEGEVTARSECAVSASMVAAALRRFLGRTLQRPPAFSALKIAGRPAYQYARDGVAIELPLREIEIHELQLRAFDVEHQRAEIEVACSKGTYIRSLAVDIAAAVDAVGHLCALRRTRTAGFRVEDAHPLDMWTSANEEQRGSWLLPTDSLLSDLPAVVLDGVRASDLRNGKVVALPADHAGDATELVRAYDAREVSAAFVGLARMISRTELRAERLLSTA